MDKELSRFGHNSGRLPYSPHDETVSLNGEDGCVTDLSDTPERYGIVSRLLHWAMAYFLLWQFLGLVGWRLLGDGPTMRTVSMLGPAHGTVGVLVLLLLLPRAVWTLRNAGPRRSANTGPLHVLARAAHGVLYLLMLVVPLLALIRAYGSGKGFELWGLGIIPATGREVGWLTEPADWLHGPLAWTLATLIGGHIAMALVHHYGLRDRTLSRMAGPLVS